MAPETIESRLDLEIVSSYPLPEFTPLPKSRSSRFERTLGAAALFSSGWLIAVGAIGNKIIDPHAPAFYPAKRVGLGGREIIAWKLRTLKPSDNSSYDGFSDLEAKERSYWWGSLLRRWSIDELPQFGLIAQGLMKLLGIRAKSWSELVHNMQALTDPQKRNFTKTNI